MAYNHRQNMPVLVRLLLWLASLFFVCMPLFVPEMPLWGGVLVASIVLLIGFMFRSLTVSDEGDSLAIQYGPLPVVSKQIKYRDISAVEAGQSSWIDGWGVHYVPLRGWTYNLWGYDCAVLRLGQRILRIGTDDQENLVAAIKAKLPQRDQTTAQ